MKNELDRYLGQIRRCLRVDKATRERILNDLTGDLYDRLRRGESAADIIADMGPAREVADGFNENFAAEGQPARPVWRWGFLAAGVLLLLADTVPILIGWAAEHWAQMRLLREMETNNVGIIGGADGPTAVFVTTRLFSIAELFLPVVLGCLAVFAALQWPGRRGWQRWLPAALAALGLAFWLASGTGWLEARLLRNAGIPWGNILRMMLPGAVKRFFTQGAFLPLGVLVWLWMRRRRAQKKEL